MFSFLIDEKEILIGYIVGLVLLLRILFPDRRINIGRGLFITCCYTNCFLLIIMLLIYKYCLSLCCSSVS